jgi:hypothetical protein
MWCAEWNNSFWGGGGAEAFTLKLVNLKSFKITQEPSVIRCQLDVLYDLYLFGSLVMSRIGSLMFLIYNHPQYVSFFGLPFPNF